MTFDGVNFRSRWACMHGNIAFELETRWCIDFCVSQGVMGSLCGHTSGLCASSFLAHNPWPWDDIYNQTDKSVLEKRRIWTITCFRRSVLHWQKDKLLPSFDWTCLQDHCSSTNVFLKTCWVLFVSRKIELFAKMVFTGSSRCWLTYTQNAFLYLILLAFTLLIFSNCHTWM